MKETKETKPNAELDKKPDLSSPAKPVKTNEEETGNTQDDYPYIPPPPPPVH